MQNQHTEKAFESAIEQSLLTIGGYAESDCNTFDPDRLLDPTLLLSFIRKTHPTRMIF